jgi:citrate synthase
VWQPDSKFAAAYSQGLSKKLFWEPVYEDSLDLIAKMPGIAANIYRRTYKGGKLIEADPKLDWAGNLAHQMGTLPPHLAPTPLLHTHTDHASTRQPLLPSGDVECCGIIE